MTSYTFRLGARYEGNCVKCGRSTGSRGFELENTLLLKDSAGKYAVAHPVCCGIRTKERRGGRVIVGGPSTIEI